MHEKTEKRIAAQMAKTLTMMCVRNTFLEDLHAGKVPISETGDYSDVKVIDGTGREIARNDLSRLNDEEMKILMKEVVNRIYTYFLRADDPDFGPELEKWAAVADRWDDPELILETR